MYEIWEQTAWLKTIYNNLGINPVELNNKAERKICRKELIRMTQTKENYATKVTV